MDGRYLVFESFVFDSLRNELTQRAKPIALTPKTLELLALFLEHPGELLTKDFVLETLWPGEDVQEGNLAQQVYLLRKSLADFGGGDLILTVPRRGYRFAAEVRALAVCPASPDEPRVPRAKPLGAPRAGRALVAVAMVLAIGAGLQFALRTTSQRLIAAQSPLPPAAARAYQLARYYYDEPPFREMALARESFLEVTRLAPQSPLGYAGLADTELRMANLSSRAQSFHAAAGRGYALEALRLDPSSVEARVSYGCWLDWFGFSAEAASREFETAIALAPKDAPAHLWLGVLKLYAGDFTKSIAELREAARLAPTSFLASRWLGVAYYYSRDYADAIPQFQQTLTLYSGSGISRLHIAMALELTRHPERALPILRGLSANKDFTPVELRTWIAYCRAKEGDRRGAAVEADRIAGSPDRKLVAPTSLAAVYVAAGEPQKAVALLQAAKLSVLTMWSQPENAALVPRFDPRLAVIYREGRLKDAR